MYWREIPEPERSKALARAEEILESFPTSAEVHKEMLPDEFNRCYEAAKLNIDSGLDIPDTFSKRAREGLLGAHILAAKEEEMYSDDLQFRFVLDLILKGG